MRVKKRRKLVVRDVSKVRALRTPLRQEILNVLERLGSGTVKEMAAELRRPPASLYYHIHKLVDAGLVNEAGSRPAGRRREAVYEAAAEKIIIDRSVATEGFTDALMDLHRATLRAAERESIAALSAECVDGRKRRDDVTLLRLTARLRPADARRARQMLREIARFMKEHDGPDTPTAFAFTTTLVRVQDESDV